MKKIVAACLFATIGCCGIANATETPSEASSSMSVSVSSSDVSFPTGVFFNGSDFVKVERSWVRVVVSGQMDEYDVRHSERDPWGNYALVLSNGESLTIYSDGRSLYYDGTTYKKKSY